jgi:hypothetical protein
VFVTETRNSASVTTRISALKTCFENLGVKFVIVFLLIG